MKKNLIIILTVLLLMGSSQTYAQTTGVTNVSAESQTDTRVSRPTPNPLQRLRELLNTRKAVKTEVRENVKDIRQNIASSTKETRERMEQARLKLASSTEKRAENLGRKISKTLQNMVDRFEATITREETIMAKINSRIEKIKVLGGQTADAEKLVADAKIHLGEAKTAIEVLKKIVSVAIGEENASSTARIKKETQTNMKKAAMEVEKHLRELRNASSTKEN